MTTMRVLTGSLYNILGRGTLTVSSEDSVFTKDRLYDGRPSKVYRAASAVADLSITIDGDLFLGAGALDTWSGGSPSGWTVGTSGVTQEAVNVVSGSAAKLTAGSSQASIYKDITVRSGEVLTLQAYLAGDGIGSARLRAQNLRTQNYVTSSGGWTSAITNCASVSTTGYILSGVSGFTMESFATALYDTVTLRVTAINNSTGQVAYVDEAYIWPAGVDFMSAHGHNLDPTLSAQFIGMNVAASSGTLEATATIAQPSFYTVLSSGVDFRFWKLKLVGTNSTTQEIGELVIGQSLALQQVYKYEPEIKFMEDDIAPITASGEEYAYVLSKSARRVLGLNFFFDTTRQPTSYTEARDEIFRRSRGRQAPLVVVPDTSLSDVIHGKIDKTWKAVRALQNFYDQNSLVITETPFASSAL